MMKLYQFINDREDRKEMVGMPVHICAIKKKAE